MKKFLIVLLSAAIMSVPGCKKEGDKKNDLKTLKLQGKIKTIRSISYTAKDESGKIVKKNVLLSTGQISTRYSTKRETYLNWFIMIRMKSSATGT